MKHPSSNSILPTIFLAGSFLLCASACGEEDNPAPTAWELSPYRIQVLTAVDADAALPLRFEQDLQTDLPARTASVVGGAWRVEAGSAPAELRHRILHSIAGITAGDLPAATKKGDKVILLGIAAKKNGYEVQARELDVVAGLWNAVVSRDVRQVSSVKQQAVWGVLAAFAPLARIEKVEDKIVTLRLRAAGLARRDSSRSLLMPGTVFRPVLMKSDARGVVKSGDVQRIDWTLLTPIDAKIAASTFTCKIETGISGTVIPDYHPTRQRWALGVSPSRDSTKLRLVAEGTSAPLESYEVLGQEPDIGGKPGEVKSLGRSGADGVVVVPPAREAVRMLNIRHGEEVLARLPLAPGLAEEVTISLPDDRPRLAIENVLSRIQDDLVDLVARREVLASRARAATKGGDANAAGKLNDQLKKLPGLDPLLAELTQQQQAIEALEGLSRQKMQKRLADLRKLAEKLKSDNPADKR